jgi:nucleoid-associated protein YgaU
MMAEKLLIENQDTGEKLPVQFNPERYSIEKATTWSENGRKAALQFGGHGRKSIILEFFFDTFTERKDVRVEHVRKLLALMEPTVATSTGRKRPPVLLLTWGGFNFQCVLEKLSQNYTMFAEDGTPVRAVVNATFKQFSTADEESRNNPPGDPTKSHQVKDGETLNLIASKEYGNPTLWRIIARENRLGDPRVLQVGSLLVIPALE